jgi:sec-independent protein translocase protein TatB
MFDLTSSKLLILGLVALIVVGPKDLPVLLRTIGKYMGLIRRQASEFRAQFDEAMREQELASLRAEMEAVKRDVQDTVTTATRGVTADVADATRDIDNQIRGPEPFMPPAEPGPAAAPQPYIPATSAPALTPDPPAAVIADDHATPPPAANANEPAAKVGA